MGKIKVPSISSIVKNPVAAVGVGGLLGGTMGAQVGGLASALSQKGPQAPQLNEDPRLTELRGKMDSEAKQFRADMPKLVKDEQNSLKASADAALASGTKQTRQNYNRRGLLYSGLRQGAEESVKGGIASNLARGMAGVNKQYEDIASAKENAAANVGLSGYSEAIQRANQLYDSKMQNQVERQQSLQQFGSGLGYLGGMAYANAGSNPAASPAANSNAYYNPNSYLNRGVV